METIDPTTGQKLPADAIQRVLYIASKAHVYQIPPLTSTRGYTAGEWKNEIFTGRLRILETAVPRSSSSTTPASTTASDDTSEDVKVDILIEDSSTGELFAAAPYTTPAVVEQALDSSRFFAVQFRNQGMKATLGVGFENRSEAMDFNISLQDARKVLGLEPKQQGNNGLLSTAASSLQNKIEEKKDFSLKAGETITVNIGGRGRRSRTSTGGGAGSPAGEENRDAQAALFSIKPPPPSGGGGGGDGPVPFLPPPPSASSVKAERRRSRPLPPQAATPPAEKQPSPQELGFDDGEFGEFQ
ncbi:adaptin ear-binding coat-associated protein-like protein 1 [Macrophomina phaseolina]|uniref:Adaptin ear-binding coat-associated protein-like protein 1 n=1 Tax=Macrophomina phaseolina TaxID=35725 RepID=A0ABQ8GSK5_9PEZI|nr:adaptin ear-binding coat-associated protein-like protein 1 [Macrophomina phaseolina]